MTQSTTGIVFGSISLKPKAVLNANVEDLVTNSFGEYEIFNSYNNGISTITVRTTDELKTFQIGEHDFEVEYCDKTNEFLITFSINVNTKVDIINKGEIQPISLIVYGSVPISENEALQYSKSNTLEYMVVQEVDGKELFINKAIDCDVVKFEFENEY